MNDRQDNHCCHYLVNICGWKCIYQLPSRPTGNCFFVENITPRWSVLPNDKTLHWSTSKLTSNMKFLWTFIFQVSLNTFTFFKFSENIGRVTFRDTISDSSSLFWDRAKENWFSVLCKWVNILTLGGASFETIWTWCFAICGQKGKIWW